MSSAIPDDSQLLLEQIRAGAQDFQTTDYEVDLTKTLLDAIYTSSGGTEEELQLGIAAIFDLLVAARYYEMQDRQWYYCDHLKGFIQPYTNACSHCLMNGQFVYIKGNKPGSSGIGGVTAPVLALLWNQIFVRRKLNLFLRRGKEPVDVIVDDSAKKIILVAEIKAAPLMTLPLVLLAPHQNKTAHELLDEKLLPVSDINLFLPTKNSAGQWQTSLITLGLRGTGAGWFHRLLSEKLASDPSFLRRYVASWTAALETYEPRTRCSVFWLTNGCGQPPGWTGKEAISDSKTSVGMDRTDDIKKAIYQVTTLGAKFKPSGGKMTILTGIISNIHAARHYKEYLASLTNIVWAQYTPPSGGAKTAGTVGELSSSTRIYNLFDGIVAFTRTQSRHKWVDSVFKLK